MGVENQNVSPRHANFSSQWQQYKQSLQQSCISSASVDSEQINRKLIREGQRRARQVEMSYEETEQDTPQYQQKRNHERGKGNLAVLTSKAGKEQMEGPVSAT